MDEILDAVRQLLEAERFGARATVVSDSGLGMTAVLDRDFGLTAGRLPEGIASDLVGDAMVLIDRERSATLAYGPTEVFIDVIAPRPSLLVFGAVHIAQELCPMARQLGYAVTVSDARPAFTTRERFPQADRLLVGWPDALADDLTFDRRTYVVVLSHDSRFEDPLWPMVLPHPVKYIGAMGSRKTAAARRERLRAAGFTAAQVEGIHGPVGLDIGAEGPAEVAVSILAEMISVRYGAGQEAPLAGAPIRLGR